MLSYALPLLHAKAFADTITEFLVGSWLEKSFNVDDIISCDVKTIDKKICPLSFDWDHKPKMVIAFNPALRDVGHLKVLIKYGRYEVQVWD